MQKAYDDMFRADLVLTGDIFLQAPTEYLQKVFKERFKKHGRFYNSLEEVPVKGNALLRIMPPGMPARRDAYALLRGNSERDFLADLDHWPNSPGGSYGSSFPCQLTHGNIWSWNKDRMCVGLEHFMAQGIHMLPALHPDPLQIRQT